MGLFWEEKIPEKKKVEVKDSGLFDNFWGSITPQETVKSESSGSFFDAFFGKKACRTKKCNYHQSNDYCKVKNSGDSCSDAT